MTEQVKVPEIRFAGFTDPWEQRKLVDIAEIVGGGTPDTNNSNYWDGDIDWYAPAELGNNIYAESSTRKITQAGFDSCSTKMLPADKTILFTSRAGIGNTAILRHSACTNQGFQSLVIGDADVYFVYSMSERIKKWAEEKASGSTFLEISGRQLETMPVNLPSLVEQQAIGSFFSHLDDLITLHQRKYDKLVIFKKSMLEKMFPKDGESVPEIRFAGFTDPWEQRKLGEIVSIGAGAPPSAFSAGNFLYVKVDDLNESSHFQFDSAQRVDANTAVKPIRKGSIIFAKRGAAILGNKVRVLGKTAYIDTNMMALEPRGVDADFLWLFINQTGLYRIADTSTIPQINNKHIEPYPVDIPNMAEQQAIGTFFSRLDDLITLHQRKRESRIIRVRSFIWLAGDISGIGVSAYQPEKRRPYDRRQHQRRNVVLRLLRAMDQRIQGRCNS